MESLMKINDPILLALIATGFTWFMPAIGAAMVTSMEAILPYALAFAAGAMLYVVVEELIPESQSGGEHESADLSTIGFIIGFAIMMILDVALG